MPDWTDDMNDATPDWQAEQAYFDSLDDSWPTDLWPTFDAPEAAAYAARWALYLIIGGAIVAGFVAFALCK